jgi:hypothetical protein
VNTPQTKNLFGTRRSDRVRICIPIEAVGVDLVRGRPFSEKGKTILISRHGAAISLKYALATDQEFTIRCPRTRQEAEARVVGLVSEQSKELIYGVAFIDPASNPWKVHFPALTGSDEILARLLMQCNVCQTLEVVHLDEIELEVFEANRRIQRFCGSCLATTLWKCTTNEAAGVSTASLDKAVQPGAFQSKGREKRTQKRIKTTLCVCVRQSGFPDDVVTCENLSRGGLLFRSSRLYARDSRIEVAVPFIAGSANIFVPAYVAHVEECDSFCRVGAAYVDAQRKEKLSEANNES